MSVIAIHPDLPVEDYHRDSSAVGSSFLKAFRRSPLHAWAQYLDPQREPRDSKHFRIGRAWHCAVFEPDAFTARYAAGHDAHPSTKRAQLLQQLLTGEVQPSDLRVLPEGLSTTSKEGKALVAEIEAGGQKPVTEEDFAFVCEWQPKLQGRDVLSADTLNAVQRMAVIARDLPISRVVFNTDRHAGQAETSIYAEHAASGVMLKIRPDYLLLPCASFPSGLVIDGKSTTDAAEAGFGRQCWNLDYGLQAALYTSVVQQALRTKDRPAFLWLAQEKEAPFAARYYSAGESLLAHYDQLLAEMLPRVRVCMETGTWPGYPTSVAPLAMPAWAEKLMGDAA